MALAKVRRLPPGDELRVFSGGKLTIAAGGAFIAPNPRGRVDYCVNSGVAASGDGLAWPTALKTIAEAVALMVAGDRCFIQGSFNEAVALTVVHVGCEFIGVGSTSNRVLWTAPDTAAPCLTVTACADVVVQNVRFRPPAANAAIALAGASNQFQLLDCRIQGKAGSWYGIRTDGGQSNVRIERCEFCYINTSSYGIAISGHTYATEPSGWMLEGCLFHSNLRHIVCRMRQSVIQRCVFAGKGLIAAGTMAAITTGIDISGAIGGCNLVQGNFLGGDYSTATYVAGTDDNWIGNTSDDLAEAEVNAATGTTIAVPAAP
jgi:hypothetical protein